MKRQLPLIAIVFLGCFGLGYGLTWLVSGPSKEVAPVVAPVAALDLEPVEADDSNPVAALEPKAALPQEGDSEAPVQAVEAEPLAAEAAPVEKPALPVEDGALAVEAVPTEAAVEIAQPAEWERCYKRSCRIDFGSLGGGISLRKGALEHGQEIDWERDFARADKVGALDAGKRTVVEVLAIGLTKGEPSAALIQRKFKRKTQVGVLALQIGDKRLRLVPID